MTIVNVYFTYFNNGVSELSVGNVADSLVGHCTGWLIIVCLIKIWVIHWIVNIVLSYTYITWGCIAVLVLISISWVSSDMILVSAVSLITEINDKWI